MCKFRIAYVVLHNKQAQIAQLEEVVSRFRHGACYQSGKWDFQKTFRCHLAGPGLRQVSVAWVDTSEPPLQRQQTHKMPTALHAWPPASCPEPNKQTGCSKPSVSQRPLSPPKPFSVLLSFLPHIPSELEVNELITDEWGHVCRGFNYSRKLAQLVFNIE